MAMNGRFYFKWGVILVLAVVIFVFFAFYAKEFGQAELEVGMWGNKISVKTSQLKASPEQIAKFDPQRYYVDSNKGFSFERPSKKTWSQPNLISGIDAVLEAKSITLTQELREIMTRNLAIHPMGPMLREVEMLRVVSGESIEIEVTDETSNEFINTIIERIKETVEEEGDELSKEELSDIRRGVIGFERTKFSNEFTISVYDKGKLKGMPIKLSLPNFFVTISTTIGLNVDHLVADEQSILMGGSLSLERVKIDEHIKDLRIDRWILLAENQERFYLVEIAYSPQTAGSIQVWEELRALMKSFHIFES